jgi:hypothetical protein
MAFLTVLVRAGAKKPDETEVCFQGLSGRFLMQPDMSANDPTRTFDALLSRPLYRTPYEADAEHEDTDGEQDCSDIGEINYPVWGCGIGR